VNDSFFEQREAAMGVLQAGRSEEALSLLNHLIDIAPSAQGRNHEHLADTLATVSGIHAKAARFEEAIAVQKRARAMFDEAASDSDAGYVHDILVEIAGIACHAGYWGDAEAALLRALEIAKRVNDERCNPEMATARIEHVKSRQLLPTVWDF